jgi:hypothetical protein
MGNGVSNPMDERAIYFGPFRLFAAPRLLLGTDKPVRLGGRAFDILAALNERAGEVVGEEELIARAWPKTSVEESSLKTQPRNNSSVGPGKRWARAGRAQTVPGQAARSHVGRNFVAPSRKASKASDALALTKLAALFVRVFPTSFWWRR